MRIKWRTLLRKYTADKDKFPFGIRFYDGIQGSGKTLSMVNDTFDICRQFPDTILVTNVFFKTEPDCFQIYYFNTVGGLIKLIEDLEEKNRSHILILIDEGLTYFAENGGIDPALMSSITQNRKNRRFIMISTQKFTRLNNRIRDFSSETVQCRTFLKKFQYNVVRDDTTLTWDKQAMDYVGDKKYSYLFKRNNKLFDCYDTRQKINLRNATQNLFSSKAPPALGETKKIKIK